MATLNGGWPVSRGIRPPSSLNEILLLHYVLHSYYWGEPKQAPH